MILDFVQVLLLYSVVWVVKLFIARELVLVLLAASFCLVSAIKQCYDEYMNRAKLKRVRESVALELTGKGY